MHRPLIALGLGLLGGVAAAQTPASPPAPPPACEAAEHRQFDFWLGDWTVTRPDTGAEVGRNTITSAANGCALYEHWRSVRGGDGRSLNVYDRELKAWVQFWIGSDGVVLRLQGGRRGDTLVLEGELASAGGRQQQRITYTPADDGSVTQHWETSDDAGRTWATSFLGVYRRTAEAGTRR
jgi:hypothetical protein